MPNSPRKRPRGGAVRRAIQLRQESVRAVAKRFEIGPTTVQKWCQCLSSTDAKMEPKEVRSTRTISGDEVAFTQESLAFSPTDLRAMNDLETKAVA